MAALRSSRKMKAGNKVSLQWDDTSLNSKKCSMKKDLFLFHFFLKDSKEFPPHSFPLFIRKVP